MKNIRETQIEGHCTKQLTSMLQKHEGHAYKEILYNCFQLKGTKEAWQSSLVYDSRLDPRPEKYMLLLLMDISRTIGKITRFVG